MVLGGGRQQITDFTGTHFLNYLTFSLVQLGVSLSTASDVFNSLHVIKTIQRLLRYGKHDSALADGKTRLAETEVGV